MSEASVGVRLHVEGADEIKREMNELHAQFQRGEISVQEYAGGLRGVSRDANTFNRISQLQTRVFLAQHPMLNNLTRAMSTFGSVSRGVLAITTAFSTSILAFQGTNRELTTTMAELQEARRQQALALDRYGFDSEEYAEATEKVNELSGKVDELNQQMTAEKVTNVLNWGAAIGIMGSSIAKAAPTIAKYAPVVMTMLRGIGAAGWIALGPLALLVGLAALIAAGFYAIITPGDQVADFLKMLFPEYSEGIDDMSKKTDIFFKQTIPNAFISFINFWGKGIETFVNMFVNGINHIIRKYNDMAAKLKLPTLSLLQTFTYTPIAQIGGGGGQSGGAGAGDTAPFATVKRAGSGEVRNLTIYNTVQGSVIALNELDKQVDKLLKENLKRMGWN